MMFTAEWRKLTEEMGYFVDLDNPYITYDNKYIETLWWLLKQLYNKGLLFKGYTIQPYSPGAGTGLSSHELNQPGCYRDVKDLTVTAQFLIKDPKAEWTKWGKPYFVAWTTSVDIAFKRGSLRWSEDRLRGCRDIQPLQRRACNTRYG